MPASRQAIINQSSVKSRMKKYLFAISSFFLPFVALAHEEGVETTGQQLKEFLPFEHLEHGHWFAVILSIILWAALIYAVYSLVQKFRKTQ